MEFHLSRRAGWQRLLSRAWDKCHPVTVQSRSAISELTAVGSEKPILLLFQRMLACRNYPNLAKPITQAIFLNQKHLLNQLNLICEVVLFPHRAKLYKAELHCRSRSGTLSAEGDWKHLVSAGCCVRRHRGARPVPAMLAHSPALKLPRLQPPWAEQRAASCHGAEQEARTQRRSFPSAHIAVHSGDGQTA